MSSFINSHLIEPVVRHARRFSFTPTDSSSADATANATPTSSLANSPPREFHLASRNTSVPATRNHNVASSGNIATYNEDQLGPQSNSFHHQATAEGNTSETIGTMRQSGFQPLLPLDDAQGTFIFETPRVLSPASELPEPMPNAPNIRNTEARTLDSLGSMSIDDGPRMTRNPSMTVSGRLRSNDTMSIHSGTSRASGERVMVGSNDSGLNLTREEGYRTASPAMSGKLPEDDGMKGLRQQIHLIRDMAISAEEKAKRMHDLMTKEYMAFKIANSDMAQVSPDSGYLNVDLSRSPRASVSTASNRSTSPTTIRPDINDLILTTDDLKPTYAPRSPDGTDTTQSGSYSDEEEEDRILGCKHYTRNVKIQCTHCARWYTCRHCHDDMEDHPLDRKGIRNMLCMLCGHPQPAAEYCRHCGEIAADYYCDICKLWENDPRRKIYHCGDCGICRRGEGLGKDYVHCKRCNVCISIAWVATHRCVERATECDCPICGEWMFTSSAAVVAMRCGHYIHRKCYDAYMQTSYKCPICNRSAVNMELQWRKLDRHIEGQPMPSQFAQTKVWITCNDCTARSCTAFHWLGNKCTVCDSYNTNEVKLVNSPDHHEAEALANAERQRMLEAAEDTRIIPDLGDPMNVVGSPPVETDVGQQMNITNNSGPSATHASHSIASPVPARLSIDLPTLEAHSVELQDPQSIHTGCQDNASNFANNGSALSTSSSRSPPSTLEHEAEMTDVDDDETIYTHPPSRDEEAEEDDVAFWGEPISPKGWAIPTMPSLPTMPSIPEMPLGMPAMPNSWTMPNMPNMPNMPTFGAMPSMPTMPSMPSMPTMPSMPSMPSMPTMPTSISPLSSWSSPRFFAQRGVSGWQGGGGEVEGRTGGDGGDEGEEEEDSDDDMTWDGDADDEEDGDVDEMELFGHR